MRFNRAIVSAGAALVSGLLVAGLTPALAKPLPDPAPASPRDAAPRPAAKHCLKARLTGTAIAQKLCMTEAEWAEQGVPPKRV